MDLRLIDSLLNSYTALGVEGECFNKIGFPNSNGAIADLNVNQKGKFHGKMTKEFSYFRMTYQE